MTTDETLLRRNVSELRALLDLSYDRERLLANALIAVLRLCEGAAFAPDRQELSGKILDDAKQALAELQARPVINRGLFSAHLNSAVAITALQASRDFLLSELKQARDILATMRHQAAEQNATIVELRAMPWALAEVLEDPELRERVAAKVKALTL